LIDELLTVWKIAQSNLPEILTRLKLFFENNTVLFKMIELLHVLINITIIRRSFVVYDLGMVWNKSKGPE